MSGGSTRGQLQLDHVQSYHFPHLKKRLRIWNWTCIYEGRNKRHERPENNLVGKVTARSADLPMASKKRCLRQIKRTNETQNELKTTRHMNGTNTTKHTLSTHQRGTFGDTHTKKNTDDDPALHCMRHEALSSAERRRYRNETFFTPNTLYIHAARRTKTRINTPSRAQYFCPHISTHRHHTPSRAQRVFFYTHKHT